MRQKRKARKRYVSGEFGEDGEELADSNQADDDNILEGRESVEFCSTTFQPEKMLTSSTENQNIRTDNMNILSTELLDTDTVSHVNAAFTSLETKDKVEKRQSVNLLEELSDSSEMKESDNVESRVNDTVAENDLSCVMDNPWYSVKARKVEGGLKEFVFICKVCGKLCHRRGNMDDHVRSHAGIKPFYCSICGNEFSRKQNLKSHFSKIHRLSLAERDKLLNEAGVPAPAVDCRQIRQHLNKSGCGMSEENDNNQNEEQEHFLNDLRESTSEEDILADKTISPDFNTSEVAGQTSNKIEQKEMLSDTNCGPQTFLPDTADLKSSIAEYEEASLSKRGFKLVEDYGAFICLAPMDGTPAKIYQCKTCKYECVRRYTMRTHTWIHTGVKQYHCEFCDNAFTRNTYLKIHLSRTHSIAGSKLDDIIRRASETAPPGAFTSPWQHEYIKPDNGLLAGLQSELSDSQAESKCKKGMDVNIKIDGTKIDDKDFSNGDNSISSSSVQIENNESQSKVHDYGKFISIETVENINQSKVYRCKVCSYECTRRYTMKTHVWTHTGFKRFCCTFCGNSFTRSTYFRFHLRKAHSLTGVDLDAVVIKATEQNNIDFPQSVEGNTLSDYNVFSKVSGGDSSESWQSEPGNISVNTPYINSDKLKTNNVALKQDVCMEVDPFCEQLEEFKESISSSADETGAESDCTVDCDMNSHVNREKTGNKSPRNISVKEVAATHAKDVFQATDNATGKNIDNADRPKNLQKESDAGTKPNELITDDSVKDIIETLMDLETLQCLKCLRFCTSKADLKAHIKTHFSIKQFSCPVCFKRFGARANMREHARIVHRFFGPFSDVNQANMTTSRTDGHSVKMDIFVENVTSISNKSKKFSNEDLKQVTVGQKTGSTDSFLDVDESLVDVENLRCKKCLKICSNKGNLKAHVRLHMNLRPFTCPVCPKTFNKKSNMRFHVRRMHNLSTLTANFMSDISGDNFSTSFDLNEHPGSKNSETPQQLPEGESKTQTEEKVNRFKKYILGRDNHIKQEALEDKQDTLTIDNDSVVSQQESGSESLKGDSLKQEVSNVTIKDEFKELVETEVKSDGINGNKLDFEALTEELWGYNMQLQDNSVKRDQELNKPTKNESELPMKDKVFKPYFFMKKESSNEKETNRSSVLNAENLNFLNSKQNIGLKCSTSESSSESKVLDQELSVKTILAKNIGRFKILANNPYADPNIVKLRLLMDEDNLQCKECLKGFANKWSLKAHVKAIHLQGKQFICSVCNKSFNFKCNLERHYSVHFPNWVDKNKNVSDVLKEHSGLIRALPLDVPTNSKGITTEILTEQSNKLADCARDGSNELEKTVQGESVTDASFKVDKRTSDLDSQNTFPADIVSPNKILSDMSESPKSLSADESDTSLLEMSLMDLDYFQCKKCLKQFANKWSLKAHVRSIHIESRKHVCPVCQKTFNHKCNLDRHFVLHPTYVPQKDSNSNEWSEFQCPDCKKTFANKWSLKAHIKSIHVNARQFVCVICQKSFNHKCNLDRHIVLHASDGKGMMVNDMNIDLPMDLSSDPIKKDEEILNDSIRYSGSSVVAAEKKGNPPFDNRPTGMMGVDKLKCTKCGKQCSSKSNLKSHVKLHQSFGHVCDICQKSFHNEEYLRIHYKIHFPLDDVQAKSHIDTSDDNSVRLNTSAVDNIPSITDVILHETEVLKTEQELPSAGSEEDGPVFCGLCGDKFDSRNALHEHFETHEGF